VALLSHLHAAYVHQTGQKFWNIALKDEQGINLRNLLLNKSYKENWDVVIWKD
jgi:hypothetical protein